jgi:phosphate transport system substrate-binding protein
MKTLFRIFVAVALLPVALSAQTVVRIHGAITLMQKLQPFAAEIGKANNAEIRFDPNGAGNGIADVAAGRADVSMLLGPVEYYAKMINEKTPGAVDVEKLRCHNLPEKFAGPGVVVVHPGVPVQTLSRDQVREIFSGKTTNWSQLGGPDLPVVPVIQEPMNGYMATLSVVFVHGTPDAPGAKHVGKVAEVCGVVAATPGGVGYLSKGVADTSSGIRIVTTQPEVVPVSSLVTLGEPQGVIKAVVDALLAKVQ